MNRESVKIQNWHGLPCLIADNSAAIFSYVDNELIVAEVPQEDLNKEKTLELAKTNHLFDGTTKKEIEKPEKQLILCLTERCNCKCRYCFLDANTTGEIMSKEIVHSAIQFAFERYQGNTVIVSAFGGEPGTQETLIREMVEYSKSIKDNYDIVNLKFAITTNGIISDSIIDFLIQNKFDVSLSMDGIEEVQNKQRPLANGSNSYDIAIHTLTKLLKNNIRIRIRSTVTKYSVNKMTDAVHLFGKMGVGQIHFEPVTREGRAKIITEDMQVPDVAEFSEELLKCIKIAKEYDTDINCSLFAHCHGSIKNKMVVGAGGMISPCVEVQNEKHLLTDSFKMGQIIPQTKTQLDFTTMRTICSQTKEQQKENKQKCENCPFLLFCNHSCPVRNYRSTGHSEHTDSFRCNLFKIVMPFILLEFYNNTFNN